MTTRAALRDLLREVLNDETAWPEVQLNAWIDDAIRDYGNFFPRHAEATLTCTEGTRVYSLVTLSGILGITRVEYPTGENPPRYLVQRSEASPAFRDNPCYDVRGSPPASLVIGEEPAAGETIAVGYTAGHTVPTSDSTAITVSDQHLEGIKLFVQWQAIKELELQEAEDPDKSTLLLNMLGLNAYRAERSYRTKMQDYQQQSGQSGYAGPWGMDRFDRVY